METTKRIREYEEIKRIKASLIEDNQDPVRRM